MPVYKWDELTEEFVTPKHSTAFGRLVTGEQVEVGWLKYRAGEGAQEHHHPHEQIVVVLQGRMRLTLGEETHEVGKGEVVHIPSNVPHSTHMLEDGEAISCKSVIEGVGHKI